MKRQNPIIGNAGQKISEKKKDEPNLKKAAKKKKKKSVIPSPSTLWGYQRCILSKIKVKN